MRVTDRIKHVNVGVGSHVPLEKSLISDLLRLFLVPFRGETARAGRHCV